MSTIIQKEASRGVGVPNYSLGGGCHKIWASDRWTHMTHALHAIVNVLSVCRLLFRPGPHLPAQESNTYSTGTGTHTCWGTQPLSAHMYLTCSTRPRMLGTDTSFVCGAARSASQPAKWTSPISRTNLSSTCQFPCQKKLSMCDHKCSFAVNSERIAPHVNHQK
jgi:hypothetical protein